MHPGDKILVVVSAMGKTTNALESVFKKAYRGEPFQDEFDSLLDFHLEIGERLFKTQGEEKQVIGPLFDELDRVIRQCRNSKSFDEAYDSIISYGELISSRMIHHYLVAEGQLFQYLDAREMIQTDDRFREAGVIWEGTGSKIKSMFNIPDSGSGRWITQGFIARSINGKATTLGREGSDFSAAIFASCLSADSVTIWKDVPGILNADPKRYSATVLYSNLSYQEAAEMSYYGASVIHPNTIKPLANMGIPLYVKSFENPELPGTLIDSGDKHSLPPTFVFKDNQCLVSFIPRNLDFINERNLSRIFAVLDQLNLRINLMQNSAVSFSICVNENRERVEELIRMTEPEFKSRYNTGLQLITVKNYSQNAIESVSLNKEILIEQRTRNTYQIIIRPDHA
jgi:aspartate kinase